MTGQLTSLPVAPVELNSTLTTPSLLTKVKRKRTISCVSQEEDGEEATVSKVRRQSHPSSTDSAPSLDPAADLQTQFADFFPPVEERAPISHKVDLDEEEEQQDVDEKPGLPVESTRCKQCCCCFIAQYNFAWLEEAVL
ncbi:unnamed protein product [Dibothriocephalus latus]|uniref:Uncharacterized protein n=1 Tax=Dibothriocephalus latus TaxID=60516 RepID=A0A3P6S7Z1_DIBLA|nr:unnamed protein product [Dibothriocephalus latus]